MISAPSPTDLFAKRLTTLPGIVLVIVDNGTHHSVVPDSPSSPLIEVGEHVLAMSAKVRAQVEATSMRVLLNDYTFVVDIAAHGTAVVCVKTGDPVMKSLNRAIRRAWARRQKVQA